MSFTKSIVQFVDDTLIDLARSFRFSYLPPLMIYVAAGISGLTGIVGVFFIKDYLNLSAAFLAGLGFWIGIPWALKMPLGHLVDLIDRKKHYLVFVGAGLIALSLGVMYLLIMHTAYMGSFLKIETWFIISALLAPVGYVTQDVVADSMTVEAVPSTDDQGNKYSVQQIKTMHMTMQSLGRVAIIGGFVLVSLVNVVMFEGVSDLGEAEKIEIYGKIYIYALIIPLVSISGVFLGMYLKRQRLQKLRRSGVGEEEIKKLTTEFGTKIKPNWYILNGSLIFVIFTLSVGILNLSFSQEIVFVGSMLIVLFLMKKLIVELPAEQRSVIVGTALIIFVFRAMPGVGAGISWWEIDILGFDQQFFSLLSLIASLLTLFGIVIFRPFMARNSIARIVVILSIVGSILLLPSVGMFYGLHTWTASFTNGVVDARFIAIINTALESPLGQVSMIPLLAWIARNAPRHLKATFFAIFASFTNLALSASALLTKHLNTWFIITRAVKDKITDAILSIADYSELGILLISVTLLTLLVPILAVWLVQKTRFRTNE